jgi:Lrp/AsnC family leucine-responsive transcriptional regulator
MPHPDWKLLTTLQEDGRASWAKLGELLGVTGPAAAHRVKRLERLGVIRQFTAIINPESVGLWLTAFVTVSLERPRQVEGFLKRIRRLDQVIECHHLTGEDDYLLKVRCRGVDDLDRLINTEIKSVPGVLRTRTSIVLRTSKESTRLPVAKDQEMPVLAAR